MANSNKTSLNLEERYNSSACGGAFDAKSVGVKFADGLANAFADGFTRGGTRTNLPKKDSIFLQGHSTKKYKG